jgi:hypothetical protein
MGWNLARCKVGFVVVGKKKVGEGGGFNGSWECARAVGFLGSYAVFHFSFSRQLGSYLAMGSRIGQGGASIKSIIK